VPRLCEVYPGICLTTEEKARENLGLGNRRMPVGVMKTEYTERREHMLESVPLTSVIVRLHFLIFLPQCTDAFRAKQAAQIIYWTFLNLLLHRIRIPASQKLFLILFLY
jgi:hypothetical protein